MGPFYFLKKQIKQPENWRKSSKNKENKRKRLVLEKLHAAVVKKG